MPPRDLGTDEAVRLWARDRQSLGICRDRQGALATATRALVAQGRSLAN